LVVADERLHQVALLHRLLNWMNGWVIERAFSLSNKGRMGMNR
jgi:hypothetical protein